MDLYIIGGIIGGLLLSLLLIALGFGIYEWLNKPNNEPDYKELKRIVDSKSLEIPIRRCSECDKVITGQPIVIVRDEETVGGVSAAFGGAPEPKLFEAIYCQACGHQNILGSYSKPAADSIQSKADDLRRPKTINEVREEAGFEPVKSLKPLEIDVEKIDKAVKNQNASDIYDDLFDEDSEANNDT